IGGLKEYEHRIPQDGSLTMEYFGKKINIRLATEAVLDGEKAVLRLLEGFGPNQSSAKEVKSLAELGLGEKEITIIDNLRKMRQGFILFAGPTGSGKSTSLNAILSSINDGKKNIVTIEDPIEYHLPGATQVSVNETIGKTFNEILKRSLRADPDVILIGEIRDLETAETAASASMTGHLVFSTIHAEASSAVFKRLMSLGLNPDLATSVISVISQRLVPTICDRCKKAYVPTDEELSDLNLERKELENGVLYKGKGCSKCQDTGVLGRIGVFEIMLVDSKLRELIDSGQGMNSSKIEEAAIESGMLLLEADVKRKLLAGLISLEEAMQIINNYKRLNYIE
ncbi:GspE/PulE family protein, partial [Candidatus Margulisiibacteriota bacterium]